MLRNIGNYTATCRCCQCDWVTAVSIAIYVWMFACRAPLLLSGHNVALRSPLAYINTIMLGRALSSHASSNGQLKQKTLRPNNNAVNAPQVPESNKRKFERTMSNSGRLGTLHGTKQFWTENDFDDDINIDLSDSPTLPKRDVQYATLDRALSEVRYPELPPVPHQPNISSSAPAPWSSSPPEHLAPPSKLTVPTIDEDEDVVRPSKRRTLPWLDQNGKDKDQYTPLPANKPNAPAYPWNKTASAMKKEQVELRKRNRQKIQPSNPQSTKASAHHLPRTILSEEQKHILDVVVDKGKSVFFTGAAGTGKSVLMRAIIHRLRDQFKREPDRIAVTASTGLAACNIEGMTLHSFAGIGLGRDPATELVKRIKRNGSLKQRWMRTKVLVIDEVSMVDGELFDKLETIARLVRGSGRPFGGIQLVVTGDFFQLPPVPEKNSSAKFAFDAATWNTSIEHTILLTHVFRQKDPAFASILNDMRLGKTGPAINNIFRRLARPLDFADDIEATELFPTRAEVDTANQNRMMKLLGSEINFPAVDGGTQDPVQRAKTLSNSLAPENLTLKNGSQVMQIKNLDSGLVNGSIGKVLCFMNEHDFTIYQGNEEMFLQSHEPDDVGDAEQNEINAKARATINAARYKSGTPAGRPWPMVRFSMPDGTSRDLLCQPEEFKVEAPGGEILAKRIQVPLILAWALSIHKAQGQTLERVKVNLGKVFEKGQAYVAISRATSQSGLQVIGFEPSKVCFSVLRLNQ